MTCTHEEIEFRANVNRLTDEDGGPIVAYIVDLEARCAKCGERFLFKGGEFGVLADRPALSPDRAELRCPIEPEGETTKGFPGFRMRPAIGRPEGKAV